MRGIAVGTSSGRIVFKLVGNNEDIHAVISKLLMDRQNSNNNSTSSVEELKKFKSLLDEGVITQEEFDAKKKRFWDYNLHSKQHFEHPLCHSERSEKSR